MRMQLGVSRRLQIWIESKRYRLGGLQIPTSRWETFKRQRTITSRLIRYRTRTSTSVLQRTWTKRQTQIKRKDSSRRYLADTAHHYNLLTCIITHFNYQIQMSKQYSTQSTKDLSDEDTSHSSKRLFFIELTVTIIYAIGKIALTMAVLGLGASNKLKEFKESNSFVRSQQNLWLWEQQIIIDFKVVRGFNCPQSYQQYTNYSWPGNIQGCFCTMSVGLFSYEVVMQGRCSQREFQAGCLSVPPHQQILFQFWQPESHLCIKRLKNYNFYASQANIVNPLGYAIKNCSNYTDYQIDLIDPIPCPVTNITSNISLNQTILQFNFSFSREGQYPIVYFRLSEYEFCEGLNQYDITPGRRTNYILEKNYRYQCNSKDSRTILIGNQSQTSLFRNNPKISYVVSTLPGYPQLNDDVIYKLGFVRYPAWTYLCRNSNTYNLQKAKEYINLSFIQSTFTTLIILATISSLTGLIFLAYYSIKVYLYLKVKNMHGYLYLKDYQIKRVNPHTNIVKDRQMQIVKSLIFLLSPLATIIFLVLLYSSLSSNKDWFENVHYCTSGSFVKYLDSYDQWMGDEMVMIVSSIFINLAIVCMEVIYLIWRSSKGDLEQKEQQEESLNSVSKATDQQVSIVNDLHYFKEKVSQTEECLIENTFNHNEDNRGINIINIDEDQILEQDNYSQYSQSSKSD